MFYQIDKSGSISFINRLHIGKTFSYDMYVICQRSQSFSLCRISPDAFWQGPWPCQSLDSRLKRTIQSWQWWNSQRYDLIPFCDLQENVRKGSLYCILDSPYEIDLDLIEYSPELTSTLIISYRSQLKLHTFKLNHLFKDTYPVD